MALKKSHQKGQIMGGFTLLYIPKEKKSPILEIFIAGKEGFVTFGKKVLLKDDAPNTGTI